MSFLIALICLFIAIDIFIKVLLKFDIEEFIPVSVEWLLIGSGILLLIVLAFFPNYAVLTAIICFLIVLFKIDSKQSISN